MKSMNSKVLKYFWGCSALMMVMTGQSFAETAEAEQTVSVSVPKTLLLDVEDRNVSITHVAPTVAGQGFTSTSLSNNTDIKVAITSNVSTAKLYAKASVNNEPLSDYNLKLSLFSNGGIFNTSLLDLTDVDQQFQVIGNHVSGLVADSNEKFTVLGGLASTSEMPPYGSYNAMITYTLKEN